MVIARSLFPGKRNSLDALCLRFNVKNDERSLGHGALIDSIILSRVYFYLSSFREKEVSIFDTDIQKTKTKTTKKKIEILKRDHVYVLSEEESREHKKIIEKYGINWPNMTFIYEDNILETTYEFSTTDSDDDDMGLED